MQFQKNFKSREFFFKENLLNSIFCILKVVLTVKKGIINLVWKTCIVEEFRV